jgi:hypothetical protein
MTTALEKNEVRVAGGEEKNDSISGVFQGRLFQFFLFLSIFSTSIGIRYLESPSNN